MEPTDIFLETLQRVLDNTVEKELCDECGAVIPKGSHVSYDDDWNPYPACHENRAQQVLWQTRSWWFGQGRDPKQRAKGYAVR